MARAGMLAGTFVGVLMVAAPLLGRAVDRLGSIRILGMTTLLHCAALGGLALATTGRSPLPISLLAAAATGATAPPTAPALRAVLSRTLDVDRLTAGLALESILVECAYLTGPLLVAALGSLTDWLPLTIAGTATAAGTVLMIASRPLRARAHDGQAELPRLWSWGPLSVSGVRRLLPIAVVLIPSMALLDVAIATHPDERHQPYLLGLIMGGVAAGSVMGGLVFGARPWPGGPAGQLLTLTLWFAGLAAASPLAASPWLLALLTGAAGLAIAPSLTLLSGMAVAVSPRHHRAETFTWLSTMNSGGQLLFIPAAGALGQHYGPSGPFILITALATATGAYTFVNRRSFGTSPEATKEARHDR